MGSTRGGIEASPFGLLTNKMNNVLPAHGFGVRMRDVQRGQCGMMLM